MIIILILLLAGFAIAAFFFPYTSLNFSLLTTILFSYVYFLVAIKVYKCLKSKSFFKYFIVTLFVLILFVPYFVLSTFIGDETEPFIRLHGFKAQLTGFPLPQHSAIVDSKSEIYFPEKSDDQLGFDVFLTLKTLQKDKEIEAHYNVFRFKRAGPTQHRDGIHPYITINRESVDTVTVSLHDAQSYTSLSDLLNLPI